MSKMKILISIAIIVMISSIAIAISDEKILNENLTYDINTIKDNMELSNQTEMTNVNKTAILENFTMYIEALTEGRTSSSVATPVTISYTNPSSGISVFTTKFNKEIYVTGGQYWAEYSFYLPVASYVNIGMSGTVVSNLNANAYTNYVLIADGDQWGSYVDSYPTYSWFNGGYMGISSTELFYLNKGWHTIYLLGQSTPNAAGTGGVACTSPKPSCYNVWGSLSIIAIPEYTAITVKSPNGGESWARGTTKTIAWTSNGNPGTNVKIELYKSGVINAVISSKTPNDGSYSWYIPTYQPIGTDYKIKITSYDDSKYYDWSDNNFKIY